MDPRFEAALAQVDRQVFLNNRTEGLVVGRSIPSTENLRRTLAIVTLLPSGPNVLHVGAGLGYASVVLAQVARKVVAIEINALLARAIATNIEQLGVGNVVLRHGDGSGGAPDFAPFDLILVASPSIEQKSALLSQLSPRGQLVCVEWGEASLLTLVKYTHDGRHHYVRSEHGYMDFVPNRDEILIELGLVSDELLVRARQLAKTNKTTIIDEVRKLNNLNDMELYRSLARQYGLQLGEVEQLLRKVDPKYFGACSKAFLDHQHLIPLYPEGGSLKVATDNPTASMVEIQKVFPKEKSGKFWLRPRISADSGQLSIFVSPITSLRRIPKSKAKLQKPKISLMLLSRRWKPIWSVFLRRCYWMRWRNEPAISILSSTAVSAGCACE